VPRAHLEVTEAWAIPDLPDRLEQRVQLERPELWEIQDSQGCQVLPVPWDTLDHLATLVVLDHQALLDTRAWLEQQELLDNLDLPVQMETSELLGIQVRLVVLVLQASRAQLAHWEALEAQVNQVFPVMPAQVAQLDRRARQDSVEIQDPLETLGTLDLRGKQDLPDPADCRALMDRPA